MTNRADTFDRADNPAALGTPSDAGSAWVAVNGVWVISSNQAANTAGTSNALAYLESSAADGVVQATISVVSGAPDIGVAARVTDINNFVYGKYTAAGGGWYIVEMTGGTPTIRSGPSGSAPSNGAVVALTVTGSAVSMTHNGANVGSGTLVSQLTATKHGLYLSTDSNGRLDTFSFTDSGGGAIALDDGSGYMPHRADRITNVSMWRKRWARAASGLLLPRPMLA
jgi:hypothetical protein